MTKKKKNKIEWIIIAVLFGTLTGVFIYFYYQTKQLEKMSDLEIVRMDKKEIILQDYIELELAYDKALYEIQTELNKDNEDISLNILKQQLADILVTIKNQKNVIEQKKAFLDENDSIFNLEKPQHFKDMLNMSKDVLVQKLAEAEAKNQSLEELNKDLTSNNQKLKKNLEEANNYFEKEKIKNYKLNEKLINISNKIDEFEKEGTAYNNQLNALKREKREYENRLKESNELLNFQNYQIKELGEILKKINIDCYFVYEKGNKEKEAKIYLTAEGITEVYLKYFLRVKPNIHIDFQVNSDIFPESLEKIDLKIYDSKRVEIFSIPKAISDEEFHIIIPNKNFFTGSYYIKLKAGDDDLLIGGEYLFKIGM